MPKRPSVDDLIDQASALSAEDQTDAALEKYSQALALDPGNFVIHYNIGLIHKYRGAWRESFEFNKRANELDPSDEAAQWNLAIAATALRDWKTARKVWASQGIKLPGDIGPIEDNFGRTPIRLNPDDSAEVVWAERLCPVRARIINIPYPESNVAYDDIVLNDGAPMGSRLDADGQERFVFNMLEMFERSGFSTYVVEAVANSSDQVAVLEKICDERELKFEDWRGNVRTLCRACSEGRPHEQHDHSASNEGWARERRFGIAARRDTQVQDALAVWGGEVTAWWPALERPVRV